jgi:DNA-binding NtrC family response regulator
MASILIIDDERSIRSTLRDILEYEKYEVDEAEDGRSGISKIKEKDYDLVFCDIKMPKMDGIEVLEMALAIKPGLPFIMISGHGNIETAVEAIKKGAYDFLSKPLDLHRLLVNVRNGLERGALVEQTQILKKQLKSKTGSSMVGSSPALLEVLALADKAAPTEARILITGSNGTGKELLARHIHDNSGRASGPFIEVNCAAIPSELIESELFGHEKGAFTSAIKTRKGKFEQAESGTLFLDEIGDMSLSAQAKVLRALQENRITRVGGEKDLHVNVRVLAATNKDLSEEIKAGRFREDLYHRLCVIHLKLPSLSQRKEDIPELAQHFIKEIAEQMGMPSKILTPAAIEALSQLPWTGNVRELRNVIERLLILCDTSITEKDVKRFT